MGPKACPVELDINSARLDGEIHSFFRRLRLTEHFKDKEDLRSIEEKRFYTKKLDFLPEPGKSAPLDMFIFEFLQKWNSWKPPRRIKDDLNKLERKGNNMIKEDLANILNPT